MATETKVIISGDSRGAEAAAKRVESSLGGVQGAVKRLSADLTGFQSLAARALSFAGISLGVAEIIKMGDTIGQLNARLQLATRFTGDYRQVQDALADSANKTRSSLENTVELYTKISPALLAAGKSSKESVGLITTVNQAIALSGVRSEAAAAGLFQFTQALGSGLLAGDELRSILENTPGLADALAEGLGVARGELRKLGSEGKLTTEVILEALGKVAPRVEADFAKLPVTVAQALTLLQNNLTQIIGGGAQATGVMGSLARAIVQVSDGIKNFSEASQDTGVFTFLTEAVDGFTRTVRIAGKSLGALAASLLGPLDLEKQKAIWKSYADDVAAILAEPLQRDKIAKDITASDKELADKRLDLERKYSDKFAELADLRARAAGKASDDILETDAKRTDEQIKNAEKVRDALLAAWQASVNGASAAGDEAAKLLAKAGDIRQTGADKAAALRRSQLSPEDQQTQIRNEFENAASSADRSADLATIARLHNRVEAAAKLTAQAEKDAERAAKFADQIDDPQAGARAIEQAAELQARLVEGRAAEKKNEQKQLEEQAAAQQAKLAEIDAQLTALQTKAASLKVEADISAAEGQLASLQAQLDGIQDKTVTVTVNTVQTGAAPAAPDDIPARAYGGVLPGWAPHDRADNMIYRGTPGEWVMQRRAVRYYGPDFMAALNAMRLPKYANGGLLGNLLMPSISSAAPSAPASSVTLNFPGMGKFPASMAPDVLGELQSAFSREALKKGARR
ncbi:MAG: tape measure protein [Azonexus sp.]|nr:tape measure protein [Azonexus sp.]